MTAPPRSPSQALFPRYVLRLEHVVLDDSYKRIGELWAVDDTTTRKTVCVVKGARRAKAVLADLNALGPRRERVLREAES